MGARVSLSAYSAAKNGNGTCGVETDEQDGLRRLVGEVPRLKISGAAISSSTY